MSLKAGFGTRLGMCQDQSFLTVCEAILIGYSCGTTGYKTWDIEEREVVISHYSQVDELGESQRHSFLHEKMMRNGRTQLI